jgi:hypothetical protein
MVVKEQKNREESLFEYLESGGSKHLRKVGN